MRKAIAAGLLAVGVLATGCSGGDDADSGKVEGEITVLTQRTDIVNTVFQEYKKRFEAKYPDVKVKFEAITDYEGEVRIRMGTKDYGDVLLIPNSVNADQLPAFFEPLGTVDELKDRYRFVRTEQTFDGKVYGLAITGNAQGFVYNKKVWAQAGITAPPKTPEEFLAALKAVKEKTGAIPLYTNYKETWPLGQWEGLRGTITGDPDAVTKLAQDDAPWTAGKEHHVIDSLLFDVVKQGLTEPDPTTTNWEQSKGLLGTGKVATMALGSWSVVQMQAAAPDKADIGYLPFPTQTNGKFHTVVSGDYKNAVNRNSKHKAAARAWVEWFADESNYAVDQGGVPVVLGQQMPATLADLAAADVQYLEFNPAPKGQEGLDGKIGNAAEIALFDGKYRQRIVDAARGAKKESKEDIFADLNKRWKQARATVK
ncbi:sugar ABC transporter substrate-binding protein [Virgisporangium aliadipatigenens]|uniref:Sugar ABC transporter substrate-binding protein n=1 Tax=Virgisporangium aliadipatigenens TaxID=741659 RepID=A0A8J4DMV5_9ACTN|nr:ABC transporter substrate-binding protein [Virgisporangium aliadipatigenens]GIJ43181.1 sugar ABC transporter substrate-binding protein [Virgisporangium aliadipatigenens]